MLNCAVQKNTKKPFKLAEIGTYLIKSQIRNVELRGPKNIQTKKPNPID